MHIKAANLTADEDSPSQAQEVSSRTASERVYDLGVQRLKDPKHKDSQKETAPRIKRILKP